MKKWLTGLWLSALLIIVGSFFWFNQLVYSLPTPVPSGYKNVGTGEKINLQLPLELDKGKPTFLHFFNPDCPCSRFNISEFKALAQEYKQEMNFVVVMMTDKAYKMEDVKKRFGITVPIVKDINLAQSCGVYSTPQAVLLKPSNELYFRGNYNRTRYCTDEQTRFAKLAVKNLLLNHENKLEPLAFKAYGCSVPNCSN
jgi:hypothetical protein